jgi:hypothetical protein
MAAYGEIPMAAVTTKASTPLVVAQTTAMDERHERRAAPQKRDVA